MTATVELAAGELACGGCGRAVPAGLAAGRVILADDGPTVAAATLARCPGCAALDVTARALAGPDAERDATDRLARVLACFRVLGRPLPDPAKYTAAEIGRWFGGFDLSWSAAMAAQVVRPGHAAAEPWAHVRPELRRVLADRFRRWLHVRAFPGRPVPIPAPDPGGCLLCGLDAQTVPAAHAHNVTPESLWRAVSADPGSLGGKGARRLEGALCGACVAAVSDGGRLVLGPTTLETALARHWESVGESAAAALIRQGLVEGVVAWGVTGRPPSSVPWSHMQVPSLSET